MDAQRTTVPDRSSQAVYEQQKLALEGRIKGGANWFYWIAALSLVNTTVYLANIEWSFIVGLGITQVFDVVMSMVAADLSAGGATIVRLIGLGADFIVIGMFLGLGLLGNRRMRWAMIVGMVLYALDGIIFVVFTEILSILFHLLALFFLWGGLQAMNQLRALEKKQEAKSLGII